MRPARKDPVENARERAAAILKPDEDAIKSEAGKAGAIGFTLGMPTSAGAALSAAGKVLGKSALELPESMVGLAGGAAALGSQVIPMTAALMALHKTGEAKNEISDALVKIDADKATNAAMQAKKARK